MSEKSWKQIREELKMLPRQMCVTPVAEVLEYVDEILKLQQQLQSAQQEIERLKRERDAYYNNAKYTEAAFHEVTSLRSQLQSAQQDRDKLIEALRWYAKKDTHEIKRRPDGDYAPIVLDHGQRAREILKEIEVDLND